MNTLDYLNGCLDAGDIPGAAACILGDSVSILFERPSIERLFRIAYVDQKFTRCDALMIEIIRDFLTEATKP